MKINDASAIAIAAINQLYGSGVLPVADGADPAPATIDYLDQSVLTDIGSVITGNHTIAVNFICGLIDQCSKIIFDSRDYVPELPSIYIDSVDWGGFTEFVHVGLSDIMTDEAFNELGFVNYSDPNSNGLYTGATYAQHIAEIEHGYYTPRKHAKVYDTASALMVPLSVQREAMKTAFKNEGELARFISLLYQSVQNTLKAKAEVYALALVQSAIAITLDKADTNNHVTPPVTAPRDHAVHLISEFDTITGTNYTGKEEEALLDPVFMAFALKRMAEVKDEFQRYSTAFNNGKDIVFTPESDVRLVMLSQIARAAKFGVRANTYHEELLGIGDYDTVTSWQAIRDSGVKPFDLATNSTVKIANTACVKFGLWNTNATHAWVDTDTEDGETFPYVIGIAYDRYALGLSIFHESTSGKYISSNLVYNQFSHNLLKQMINDDYNMCVFVLD